MGTSKTARASMVQSVGEKKVIPDADYIKNLRYDVNNGIHATQEGAKALLRAYDEVLLENHQLVETQAGAEAALGDKVIENEKLYKELLAANARITELEAEIKAAQDIFSAATVAEAKNNHD